MNRNMRKFRWYAAVILMVCMFGTGGLTAMAGEMKASTMRLTKTEGTVAVTNRNGRDMGAMVDMKLF